MSTTVTKNGVQVHKDYDAEGNWVGGFERPIPSTIINSKVTVPIYTPTGGLYYHTPFTDAPPFVATGQEITNREEPVSMIQVENTFYMLTCPILNATFIRHLVENGAAVKGGQAIYEVEITYVVTDLEKEPGNIDWWLELSCPTCNIVVLPGSVNKVELEAFIDVIGAGLKKNATDRTVDLHVTLLLIRLKTHGRVDLDQTKQEVMAIQGRLFNENAWQRAIKEFRLVLAELDHAEKPATKPEPDSA